MIIWSYQLLALLLSIVIKGGFSRWVCYVIVNNIIDCIWSYHHIGCTNTWLSKPLNIKTFTNNWRLRELGKLSPNYTCCKLLIWSILKPAGCTCMHDSFEHKPISVCPLVFDICTCFFVWIYDICKRFGICLIKNTVEPPITDLQDMDCLHKIDSPCAPDWLWYRNNTFLTPEIWTTS